MPPGEVFENVLKNDEQFILKSMLCEPILAERGVGEPKINKNMKQIQINAIAKNNNLEKRIVWNARRFSPKTVGLNGSAFTVVEWKRVIKRLYNKLHEEKGKQIKKISKYHPQNDFEEKKEIRPKVTINVMV